VVDPPKPGGVEPDLVLVETRVQIGHVPGPEHGIRHRGQYARAIKRERDHEFKHKFHISSFFWTGVLFPIPILMPV